MKSFDYYALFLNNNNNNHLLFINNNNNRTELKKKKDFFFSFNDVLSKNILMIACFDYIKSII